MWDGFSSTPTAGVRRTPYLDTRTGLLGYEDDYEPERRPEEYGTISVSLSEWDAVLISHRKDLTLPHVVAVRRSERLDGSRDLAHCKPARGRVSYNDEARGNNWLLVNQAVVLNQPAARDYLVTFLPPIPITLPEPEATP